jgi:hypothetical protein
LRGQAYGRRLVGAELPYDAYAATEYRRH